jgi:putative CRISPR-associated protein (TIGR02619 family)
MKTILCTVGTSITGSPREPGSKDLREELGRIQREGASWDSDTTVLNREIERRISGLDLSKKDVRTQASAELNSLNRLELKAGDEVVLLATDTADGRVCSERLAVVIKTVWPGTSAVVERIRDLQTRDGEAFRKKGVIHLLEVVLRYVNDPQRKYGGEIILNPTGGFKGVVPFLTLAGMLYRIPTVYIFEFSEALIRLPPMPVSFDLHLFRQARPALSALQKEAVMPEERFWSLLPGISTQDRPLYESLIEAEDGMVTLSPLAYSLVSIQKAAQSSLWISAQVRAQLQTKTGTDRKRLEAALIRFSDPVWRVGQSHSFPSCELPVFGNSRWMFRMAAFFREDRAYVCRLFDDHDAYEEGLNGLRLRDVEPWESFTEWVPPLSEEELDADEQNELEILRAEVAGLPEKIRAATQEYLDQKKQIQKQLKVEIDHRKRVQALTKTLQKKLHLPESRAAQVEKECNELKRKNRAGGAERHHRIRSPARASRRN